VASDDRLPMTLADAPNAKDESGREWMKLYPSASGIQMHYRDGQNQPSKVYFKPASQEGLFVGVTAVEDVLHSRP
jgi:hypothetical protein